MNAPYAVPATDLQDLEGYVSFPRDKFFSIHHNKGNSFNVKFGKINTSSFLYFPPDVFFGLLVSVLPSEIIHLVLYLFCFDYVTWIKTFARKKSELVYE